MYFPLFSLASTVEEDYDGDCINDRIQEEVINNTLHVKMWLSSINKEKSYVIIPTDDSKVPSIHRSFKKVHLEVDSTYYSVQGQIYTELYKWSTQKQNWILIKLITGEGADPANDILVPSLSVSEIECCFVLGSKGQYKEENIQIAHEKIRRILVEKQLLYNNGKVNEAIKDIDIYDAVEFSSILNDKNLVFFK